MNAPDPRRRKKALLSVAAVVGVIALVWGAYEVFVGSRYESTENAYVQGHLVQITPQLGGTVTAIYADDTDFVKAGQALVKLDPADAQLALQQSQAALAQAVRQVRTLYANNASLAAQVTLRQADVARAQNEVARASEDLQRRQGLVAEGAVSREELQHVQAQLAAARSQLAAAESAVVAAREQLASNQALTEGSGVPDHPNVQVAAARLREAWLATQRLALPAPVDGFVGKRTVQLGQRVAAGTPLMTLVPLHQVWVEANLKEGQLDRIRIGQPVVLTADQYGSSVQYHGQVAGLAVGTGAAFSLLPAQNATGNWIKVVQRVPVRITLDAQEVARHPLRVGLSMHARIDVRQQEGKTLDDNPRPSTAAETTALTPAESGADAMIRRVIDAQMAGSARR